MRPAVAVIAAVGAVISAYLTWVHYSGDLALCIGIGACEAVQGSRFAVAAGVPVALIGLGGFALIFALALLRLRRDPPVWADTAIFALGIAATVYVAYLTYIELFVLGAVCPWCVAVAVCAILVLALVSAELLVRRPFGPRAPGRSPHSRERCSGDSGSGSEVSRARSDRDRLFHSR